MRSRAALYRAERSAKVPALIVDADDSSPAQFWVGAAERLRMRMGGWKAEAGGTTLETGPDVTTSWGIGALLFLRQWETLSPG